MKGRRSEQLTHKQSAFVAAFVENGFNATRAAIEAGYADRSAHVTGCRLLRNAKVAQAIDRELRRRGITPAECERRMFALAFGADLADFEPWLAGEKGLAELAEMGVDTSVIQSAKVDARGGRRLQLCGKLDALTRLMRIKRMLGRGRHAERGNKPPVEFRVITRPL